MSNRTSFAPLQTHKVLKREMLYRKTETGFAPLQTHKVLKPQMRLSPNPNILVNMRKLPSNV